MKQPSTQELLTKYHAGTLTEAEEQLLEEYIEQGKIALEELQDLHSLHEKLGTLLQAEAQPSDAMRRNFQQQLAQWKAPIRPVHRSFTWIQAAAAVVVLIVGIGIGSFLRNDSGPANQLEALSSELGEMREMLALSMLDQQSPSKRMKAVYMAQEIPDASEAVVSALLKTLCNDENVNVRLITLEVLFSYSQDPTVREGLIKAIPYQDSPLVQLAIAEAMVALQEKNSVNALKGLMEKEFTPDEVKDQLQRSIQTLM